MRPSGNMAITLDLFSHPAETSCYSTNGALDREAFFSDADSEVDS